MIGEDVEDGIIGNGDIAHLKSFALMDDHPAAFDIDPDGLFYFGVISLQRGAVRAGRDGEVEIIIAPLAALGNPENTIGFFVVSVIAPFVHDIEGDQPEGGDADRQAANIDKGEQPVFVEVAPGYFEVIV